MEPFVTPSPLHVIPLDRWKMGGATVIEIADKQSDTTSTTTSLGFTDPAVSVLTDPHYRLSAEYPRNRTKINRKLIFLRFYERRKSWNKYGRLTTFCNGAIILSPVKLWWWMAQTFVLTTCVTFSIEFFYYNWIALVPAVIIAVLEWMAFYKTCLSDPGILPRLPFLDAMKSIISVLTSRASIPNRGQPTTHIITHPNGQQERLSYCWLCNHFRSSHTSHCERCDCCMIQHDHHCPVYGGCVAKNNTSSFHTMIITMAGFWMYMLGYSIYTISSPRPAGTRRLFFETVDPTPFTFYVIVAEVFAVITVPLIIKCISHSACWKREKEGGAVSDEKIGEILKYAGENNLTAQEQLQLREILEVVRTESQSKDDLNHNSVSVGGTV